MPEPRPNPPISQALRFLRRQGWLIFGVPLVAVAAAAIVVSGKQHIYRASMGIVVAQAGIPQSQTLGNQALTQTMTGIIESDVVAKQVVDKLHLGISPSKLRQNLNVSVKPDSSLLDVSYDSPHKRATVSVLSEVWRGFEQVAHAKLGVSTSLSKQPGRLLIVASLLDPPYLHAQPVSPRPARTLGFAAVLGLAVGLILAFARQSLDDRVREHGDAETWFEAPLVGTIPRRAGLLSLGGDQRRSSSAEAVELLRMNLQLASSRLGPAVLVTGVADGDDVAAAVVAELGVALARSGADVVCVEGDFHNSNLEALLEPGQQRNGRAERGFADVLQGTVGLDEALREVNLPQSSNGHKPGRGRLFLLSHGAAAAAAASVSPGSIADLVKTLSARANYVLFESASLVSSAHAVALASSVNGVLLIARQGYTRREDAEAASVALREVGARNVGVVLVDV